jgi:hypothetical protein
LRRLLEMGLRRLLEMETRIVMLVWSGLGDFQETARGVECEGKLLCGV